MNWRSFPLTVFVQADFGYFVIDDFGNYIKSGNVGHAVRFLREGFADLIFGERTWNS